MFQSFLSLAIRTNFGFTVFLTPYFPRVAVIYRQILHGVRFHLRTY